MTQEGIQEGTLDPIRRTVTVRRPVVDAFRIFTERIGDWWPLAGYSASGGRATGAVFELRVGGRIYETIDGGGEADWGRIIASEPPNRVVFSWHPGGDPGSATEVEVRFTPDGPDATRVELEHRGWKRLGARGPQMRESYGPGWEEVLGRYVENANASA